VQKQQLGKSGQFLLKLRPKMTRFKEVVPVAVAVVGTAAAAAASKLTE